jgi:hypothetical protein
MNRLKELIDEGLPLHNVDYRQIILGHANDRWLTDNEISQSVIDAYKNQQKLHVVGQLV